MTLAELIRKALDARLSDLRVALPAEVRAFDAAKQTVDVQPLIKQRIIVEDGEILESLPVVPTVPVAFPRGGGFFVSLPLQVGDTGMLVICDRNIDQWVKKGGEQDPRDTRMHTLNGAVFYPGLADSLHALQDASATDFVFGKDGTGPLVTMKADGSIIVGRSATKEAARKGDAVEATVPAGTFLVSATGGVLNPAPVTLSGQITAGSSKVKVGD